MNRKEYAKPQISSILISVMCAGSIDIKDEIGGTQLSKKADVWFDDADWESEEPLRFWDLQEDSK